MKGSGTAPCDLARTSRVCSQCFTDKPLSEFWTAWDSRYDLRRTRSYCKDCGKKYNDYTKYKLTAKDKAAMLHAQGGLCAICGSSGRLVVDHDHDSGSVRGLLCSGCNAGLGLLGDSAEGLQSALTYLKEG